MPRERSRCVRLVALFRFRPKELHESAPAAFPVHHAAHRFPTCAYALEVTMLQVHARRAIAERREAHFHFARFRQVWFVPPFRIDLPGHHEAPRRFPFRDFAPIAIRAVRLLAVAAPADAAFHEAAFHRRLTDMVAARPPTVDSRGEHLKGPPRRWPSP